MNYDAFPRKIDAEETRRLNRATIIDYLRATADALEERDTAEIEAIIILTEPFPPVAAKFFNRHVSRITLFLATDESKPRRVFTKDD